MALSRLSVYWSPHHKAERPQDREYIADLEPYDVLILDPGLGDVLDAHRASPESEIVLRYWWLDDGRGHLSNDGIYAMLRSDPVSCAKKFRDEYVRIFDEMLAGAAREGVHTLTRDHLVAHLVNEPDTNTLTDQINIYTVVACRLLRDEGITCEALQFGTGHPAALVGGPGSDVDWSLYDNALEAIEYYGHYATTHEYYNDLGIQHESVYPWHIGRGDRWMPAGPRRKIGEFGLEQLVNGRSSGHQGWQGVISPERYVSDIRWYLGEARDDVVSVRIF